MPTGGTTFYAARSLPFPLPEGHPQGRYLFICLTFYSLHGYLRSIFFVAKVGVEGYACFLVGNVLLHPNHVRT